MIQLRFLQLTVTVLIAVAFGLLVFLTRSWCLLVGVASVTLLTVFAGFITVDKLLLLQPAVIPAITARIFPHIRRIVKSYSRTVDKAAGYKLENEVIEFLNCIVENCVKSWYCHISDCQSPVSDARILINNITELFVSRLSGFNRYRALCKILQLYRQHLNSRGISGEERYCVTACPHLANIPLPKNVMSSDTEQDTDVIVSCLGEMRYLNCIVFLIISKLLGEHYHNCLLGKEILSQIIVKEVIVRVLEMVSEPEWLYNVVADILQDSDEDTAYTGTNGSCVPADNGVDFQDRSSSCFANVVDRGELSQPQVTVAKDVVNLTAAFVDSSTTEANANDDEQCSGRDDVSELYNDGRSLVFDDSDSSELDADLLNADTDSVTADVDSVGNSTASRVVLKNGMHQRSNSDCWLKIEQRKLQPSVRENGYDQQHDSDADTSPDLLPDTQIPVWKKWPSLGSILPSFMMHGDNQKSVDSQSAAGVVSKSQRCVGNQKKEVTGAEASSLRVQSCKPILMKAKSYCSSVKDSATVKLSRISHSVSMNVLVPDSGPGFLSQKLSGLVQRVTSSSVHSPRLMSGSCGSNSTSSLEFESISDVDTSATEASEDLSVDRQPQFLFDSVCISATERDVPVTKPYTVYVISVRCARTL